MMWKEAVVAYFKVLSRHSPGVRIAGLRADIAAAYLQNTKQEC
jgi:hypothetical protein